MAPGEIATTSRPLPLTGCTGSIHNACTPCSTTRPRPKSKPTTTGPKPTLRRRPRNEHTQTLHKTRDLTNSLVIGYVNGRGGGLRPGWGSAREGHSGLCFSASVPRAGFVLADFGAAHHARTLDSHALAA